MRRSTHKATIAQLFCIAIAVQSGAKKTGVHVAYLRFSHVPAGANNPGLQYKPDHRWVLPLCPEEHRFQHSMGEAAYWAELKLDPHATAAELWANSLNAEHILQILRVHVQQTKERALSEGRSSPAFAAPSS